ncbi:MAG: sulfotransferase family protein [Roseococcus sp.]|nr:sulfotransferase family protein [Roseococcus sp.]
MGEAMVAPGMPTGLPLRALPLHVFLHVPKTAGTTCRAVFQRMMGDYYFAYDQAVHGARSGQTPAWEDPAFFQRYLMIGGHVGRVHPLVRSARGAARRMILYGVMRDPVARVVSFYDYVRKRPRHPLHAAVATRTLAQVVRDVSRDERSPWANWQLFQLFGTADAAGIERALEAENYVIGRLEELESFLDAVAAFTSIPRPAETPRDNVADTGGPIRAREQPDFAEATERLADLNEAERRFMETHVRSLLLTTSLAPPGGPPHPMDVRRAGSQAGPGSRPKEAHESGLGGLRRGPGKTGKDGPARPAELRRGAAAGPPATGVGHRLRDGQAPRGAG